MKNADSFGLTFEQLVFDKKEVFLLMGYGDYMPSLDILQLIDDTLDEIKTLLQLHCSYVLQEGKIEGKDCLWVGNTDFHPGVIITHALKGTSTYLFFTGTIGAGFDEYSSTLKQQDNIVKSFVADAIGSVMAEAVVSWLMKELTTIAEAENLHISNNYSPGYCDWPLAEQKKLFQLFPEGITRIRLTDSCLMLPIKSVSGVVAIGKEIRKRPYGCSICKMPNCFRHKDRK